jgi:hypothetical protein
VSLSGPRTTPVSSCLGSLQVGAFDLMCATSVEGWMVQQINVQLLFGVGQEV